MSNQDRTPGPWVVKDDGIVAAVTPVDGGDIICEAPEVFEDSMRRWRANAEFIVRAVNAHDALLAACHSALADAEAGYPSDGHTINALKAAIAAAEGAQEETK